MPDINIFKFDGKPFEKLIDVISKGIGVLYKPRSIRKKADAKAYAIGVIETAKSKALANGKEIEAETYLRIQERLLFKELERQNNIDQIAEIAAKQLQQETNVSEKPVSKDWSRRFFNIAQDVSDEEMQEIWGRILAGEIKNPDSYSLRTLELLKNLSKEEAEIFMKFSQAKLFLRDKYFVCNNDNGVLLQQEFDISFSDTLLMVELGLIATENNLKLSFDPSGIEQDIVIRYGAKGILISRKPNVPKQEINVLVFTKTGSELSRLIPHEVSIPYIEKICESYIHNDVKIHYGDIVETTADGKVSITNVVNFIK